MRRKAACARPTAPEAMAWTAAGTCSSSPAPPSTISRSPAVKRAASSSGTTAKRFPPKGIAMPGVSFSSTPELMAGVYGPSGPSKEGRGGAGSL